MSRSTLVSSSVLAFLFLVIQSVTFTSPALAGRAGKKMDLELNETSVRQDAQVQTMVRMNGVLTCQDSSVTVKSRKIAENCMLKFQDGETGELYNLSSTDQAMELYQAGTRKVHIEGKVSEKGSGDSGNLTIQVKKTVAAN